MKTTFDIDESLMQGLQEEAARRGLTLSAFVESGLRRLLGERMPGDAQTETLPPLPTWRSGGFHVDIDDREALYRVMEDD